MADQVRKAAPDPVPAPAPTRPQRGTLYERQPDGSFQRTVLG